MKKIIILILLLTILIPAYAGSINPAIYTTFQKQSYRSNYNNQVNRRMMPYWQAQSNYTTRNRIYSDYRSYNNYTNTMRQYNSNTYRGRW